MQQQGPARLHHSSREPSSSPSALAGLRQLLWLALLIAASVAFSLGLTCATPFAAFGAAAALTLSRRDALILILSVWLANQFVGFTVLGYPWTASTFAWGVALGAVAVFATLAGQWTIRRLAKTARAVSFAATFSVTFVVYEAVLFAVAVALLGGTEDFTGEILGRIFAINAAAFVGLLTLNRLGASAGFVSEPPIALRMTVARRA
ncbi:MAG: hypothetical protein WCB44_09385 [Stellaceae bacterium]